jgi:hypothetical protein
VSVRPATSVTDLSGDTGNPCLMDLTISMRVQLFYESGLNVPLFSKEIAFRMTDRE